MIASSSSSSSRKGCGSSLRSKLTYTLMAAAAATGITSVQAQFPSLDTACTRHYTVNQGDTCDIIGQNTFTSTYQIMALNLPQAGPDCYTLEPGQSLCLGRYGNDCQMVHRATNSDTCESITQEYGISTETLLQNNPTTSCDQIYDGLMLCVLDGLVRPPANPALHLLQNAITTKDKNVQMPLGTVLIAKPASISNTTTTIKRENIVAEEEEEQVQKRHHHFRHGAAAVHRRSH